MGCISKDNIQYPPRPFQGKNTDDFSSLLRKLALPRKAIAISLGIPYSTYDNYYHGIHPFPPDLIPALYGITGDTRILDFFLEPFGLIAVETPGPGCVAPKNIRKQEALLSIGVGRIIEDTEEAIADNKVESSEYMVIHRDIRFHIMNLEKLDHKLMYLVREGL